MTVRLFQKWNNFTRNSFAIRSKIVNIFINSESYSYKQLRRFYIYRIRLLTDKI